MLYTNREPPLDEAQGDVVGIVRDLRGGEESGGMTGEQLQANEKTNDKVSKRTRTERQVDGETGGQGVEERGTEG